MQLFSPLVARARLKVAVCRSLDANLDEYFYGKREKPDVARVRGVVYQYARAGLSAAEIRDVIETALYEYPLEHGSRSRIVIASWRSAYLALADEVRAQEQQVHA